MKNRKLFIIILFYLLLAHFNSPGNNTFRFSTFSPEGGFYYDGVTHIKQDKNGFVWILMENDLYRFDGYEYKRYFSYFKHPEDKYDKDFRSLIIDESGRLFVALTDGLYQYSHAEDKFTKIFEGNVTFLREARDNGLWMTESNHFGRFDLASGTFTKLLYNGGPLTNIQSFIPDENGFFILNWGRNIFRFNDKTGEVKLFYAFEKDRYIRGFCKINNTLWLLSSTNLFHRIDIPTGKQKETINFLSPYENLFSKMIYADKNENIWISSQKGLYIFDTQTSQVQHYEHNNLDPFSLPNNSVWIIEEDQQQNIWIGTYSGGLCYINLDKKVHFKSYTPLESPLNHSLVSGFAENDKNLLIATEGGGVNQINKQTQTFTYYLNDPKKNSISSNNVKSIVIDENQDWWFATFRGGLGYYDTRRNVFKNFKAKPKEPNTILVNNLRKLILDGNSGIWIVYQLNRSSISFYSFARKNFTHINLDDEDNENYIFDICEGEKDLLWIITHKKLYMLNKQSRSVEKLVLPDSSLLYGQTLCVDGNENLWIGTVGKGLIRYNTETRLFTTFDEILKFNVSTIYSIALDSENNLWLGTDNGLFKYDTQDKQFFRFDRQDGVQGQVFYPLAAYRNEEGRLYFGSSNGFTKVDPNDIGQNMVKPKAAISTFFIDNSPVIPVAGKASASTTGSFPQLIRLNHKQSNFGFTFTSDNYLVPEKNRFKYRLKEYDDRWIEVDAFNRNVFYSKVPAGTYTFEVAAANNDGIWGDPLQIEIKRLPAPLLSWWAYSFYLFLLIGTVYLIVRYYRNQKELKMQLYRDNLNREKKEEIHRSQLRFFTNISHDFRTPLSLISASVDRLREEGLKEYYYRILSGNTKRLLGLVNELMDFKSVENGKMPLHVVKADVNHLIESFAFDFRDYASQHQIIFDVISDPRLPQKLLIDKHILEKVIMNLLNNAFKFTKKGGNILVRSYANSNDFQSRHQNKLSIGNATLQGKCFGILISDSGNGVSVDSLTNIFERYYTDRTENFNPVFGTGIGLSLVKSLVLLHKGEITVYSAPGKGTDFLVSFSYDEERYDLDEFQHKETSERKKSVKEEKEDQSEEKPKYEELTEESFIKDKRRILLAEDNDDLRAMLVDYLSTDFEVIDAENGLVASNLLRKMRIDLIISDIMMPEKDGITLCREVKENINVSHIPFILLTAKAGLESKLEGADSGADIYFEKPIDFKLLNLSVKNVFKQQQQMREYYSKNFFAESHELTTSQRENDFLRKFIEILDKNLDKTEMDVNQIAAELSMSRSKLYNKIKSITGNSIIEFITSYRLRKAAHLMIEKDLSMREIMICVGFESQSYFSRAFKKEFGSTPTAFAAEHKKDPNQKN